MIPKHALENGKLYQGFFRRGTSTQYAHATWNADLDQFVDIHTIRQGRGWNPWQELGTAPYEGDNQPTGFDPQSGVGQWVKDRGRTICGTCYRVLDLPVCRYCEENNGKTNRRSSPQEPESV